MVMHSNLDDHESCHGMATGWPGCDAYVHMHQPIICMLAREKVVATFHRNTCN